MIDISVPPAVHAAALFGGDGLDTLEDFTLLAYLFAFVGGLFFLVTYARTDWRHHAWGRHVMAFMVIMEIVFVLGATRRIFGEYPGREVALFVASWLFAGVVWWRYFLIRKGRRRRPRVDVMPSPAAGSDDPRGGSS